MHPKNGVKKVKVKKQQKPISQATAQSLLHLVKLEISTLENSIGVMNEMINDYWEASNPADTSTIEYFRALNQVKNAKRLYAKRVNQMAKISKQLKDYCNAS